MSPRAAIADVAGLPVRYLEAGAGETIVYLHGAGGAPPAGARFVAMLAENHRVLLPSRPGFDATPLGGCETPEEATAVMAEFVRITADGPVHVVAQSAGAVVGAWLAVLHPDLVAGLVLSAPSTFAPRPEGHAPPSPEELDAMLYGETPCWSGPPDDDDRARIARNARDNIARAQSADGNRDLPARLGEIAAPVLLLVATADRLVPAETMRPFQDHIARLRRVLIYGAAHELPISAGPRWVRLVGDFVALGEASVVNTGTRESPP